MKPYQRGAPFTPLSGILAALSYIAHQSEIDVRVIE